MNKRFALIAMLFMASLALAGCGQSLERLNNEGNEAFAEQDYEGALVAYHQAQEDASQVAEPHYNAANAHYRLEDYEQAQQQIEQALVGEEQQESLDQSSYYNLGNVFFQSGQYEAAIEAYKEALRLNPADLQAKQNLELALRQLQQQDQQQQDNQQDDQQQGDQQQGDQQQNDQQQGDQQQDDPQEGQQQDDPQQGDQQGNSQDSQQQDGQRQDHPQQEQTGQAEGQPQQIVGLTEEQARQLLEAAAQGAESLEEFLQQILVFPGAPPAEDW